MFEVLFYLLVILLGVPVGLFLVKLCGDEVKAWKGRFKLMIFVCLVLMVGVGFSGFEYKIPVIVSLLFVMVVDLVVVGRG